MSLALTLYARYLSCTFSYITKALTELFVSLFACSFVLCHIEHVFNLLIEVFAYFKFVLRFTFYLHTVFLHERHHFNTLMVQFPGSREGSISK